MSDAMYCVYRHTAPCGKSYIGITCQNPKRRWASGGNYAKDSYIRRAVEKYGWDNMTHEILYTELTCDEANAKERELINEYKTNNSEFGYNLTLGGGGIQGYKHKENARLRISEALKGKQRSAEIRAKISAGLTGLRYSDERRKKMSEARSGRSFSAGRIFSEESRKKMSETRSGRQFGDEIGTRKCTARKSGADHHKSKPVIQYDRDGNMIRQYPSASTAEKTYSLGVHPVNVAKCCRGEAKSAYGYIWRYADEQREVSA